MRPIEHVECADDAGLDGHEIGQPLVARSPAEAEMEVTDETPVEERSEPDLAAHLLQPIVEPAGGSSTRDGRAALDGDGDETSVVTEAVETTIDKVDEMRRRRIKGPKPTTEQDRQAFHKLVRQTRQIEIPSPEEITLAGAQGFLTATIFVNPETGMTSIGTEKPIPEKIDHREIAVAMAVVDEMKLLLSPEPGKAAKPRSRNMILVVDIIMPAE